MKSPLWLDYELQRIERFRVEEIVPVLKEFSVEYGKDKKYIHDDVQK